MTTGRDRDDQRLTTLALDATRGDQTAFETWVRETQADVWRFVAHLTDTTAADDLTQETYVRAVTALPRFPGRSSARTWLLAIARNAVVDHFRAGSVRPRTSAQDWETAVEAGLLPDELDPDRREAVVLTQILGYSYAEAAEICDCPIGTVRSRVARAREDLLAARDDHGTAG